MVLAVHVRSGKVLAQGCCVCKKIKGEKKETEQISERCFESNQQVMSGLGRSQS